MASCGYETLGVAFGRPRAPMIPLALVSREQPPGFAVISHKKTVDHLISWYALGDPCKAVAECRHPRPRE